MPYHEILRILPLVSAALWFVIGAWPTLRARLFSPFERSLAAFALLVGLWAFLDGYFLGLTVPAEAGLAILVSNVRITVITAAMAALLFAAKWICLGHSRWDALLVLPVLGSLTLIWTGLTYNVQPAGWGPRVLRHLDRYLVWAAQQVAYLAAAIGMAVTFYRQRKTMPRSSRARFLLTGGSLAVFLVYGSRRRSTTT